VAVPALTADSVVIDDTLYSAAGQAPRERWERILAPRAAARQPYSPSGPSSRSPRDPGGLPGAASEAHRRI
jgi:hypothetical protein